ncbi:hypothetical protein ABZV31_12425 [Streptomyces sp. NPDC005202]|uniref:hypothetical protein n=1 Tax=Streptomyces sp. NPDC005202 TaxID=3157021 RepID=UPI0033BCBD2D
MAADLATHFQERAYETVSVVGPDGGHEVSITKGGMFKKAVGLRTALKIELIPQPTGTLVRAGVGIFGKQYVLLPISTALEESESAACFMTRRQGEGRRGPRRAVPPGSG